MTKTNALSLIDRIDMSMYKYLYTMSIAQEATAGKEGNGGGILIIGMIIVVVGLIGFIITKNKN